jgi:hypothetical protein
MKHTQEMTAEEFRPIEDMISLAFDTAQACDLDDADIWRWCFNRCRFLTLTMLRENPQGRPYRWLVVWLRKTKRGKRLAGAAVNSLVRQGLVVKCGRWLRVNADRGEDIEQAIDALLDWLQEHTRYPQEQAD